MASRKSSNSSITFGTEQVVVVEVVILVVVKLILEVLVVAE